MHRSILGVDSCLYRHSQHKARPAPRMDQFPSTPLRRLMFAWGTLAPVVRRTLYVKLGLILLLCAVAAGVYVRLLIGPMSVSHLPGRVAASLAARIGPGWTVSLRDTAVQLDHGSLALNATGLDIRNPEGALVLRAPEAMV